MMVVVIITTTIATIVMIIITTIIITIIIVIIIVIIVIRFDDGFKNVCFASAKVLNTTQQNDKLPFKCCKPPG